MNNDELTYSQALDELRAIHARLRADDVDVDNLLNDVARASELLEFCQKKITAIGEQLEVVLSDFERPAGQ
ncbi:MAG TPA: exodeoxyribonuclease VII small subunit [Acidimicrobiia bacterium]|nr:exodeoxyribonuclease VII small subunit [Acidimicrobiia bacterium]